MKLNKITKIVFLFLIQILFVNIASSKQAEVIFVEFEGHNFKNEEEIQLACDLLGIKLETHFIKTTDDPGKLKSSLKTLYDRDILILSEGVLKYFSEDIVSNFRKSNKNSKILILGINSETDIAGLNMWSKNGTKGFKQFDLESLNASIRVVNNDQISKELGGLEYPLVNLEKGPIISFEFETSHGGETLIEVIDELGKPVCPVFIKTDSATSTVFFLSSWEKIFPDEENSLLKIMPILMFLKYSFGDQCWHGINDYANLTIDDPWLREPYGYINFADLSREATNSHFHVTIAFIPYNYKKNQSEAIEVFKKNKKNLSIAIHGNNHDLSEFRSGGNKKINTEDVNSITFDERDILQALYRMDNFSQHTGLSYDRVMIFPRGIFTKASLNPLKKHNFLMTVNSSDPSDGGHSENQLDRMRDITLEFENFPALKRYSVPEWKNDKNAVTITKSRIQMKLFLDLPVLLYTHHDFFKNGADVFNPIAATINKLKPEVIWSNLGNIAKNLYLQKRISNSEIEILSFTNDIDVKNRYQVPMKFIFRKQEDFLTPIQSVEVDGIKHEYSRDGNNIKVEVTIEPGCEENVRVIYNYDYQVENLDLSDSDLQTALIRSLSGFRDNYLSQVPFGDKVIRLVYKIDLRNIISFGLFGAAIIILIILILNIKCRFYRKL